MSFVFSKKGGKLIFNDNGGYETRNPSTIWCIRKANEIYKWDDFQSITVSTEDVEYDANVFEKG